MDAVRIPDSQQLEHISEGLHVDLRRTNPFLRAVLFLFTVLIVAASVALFVVTFHVDDNGPIVLTCLVSSGICYALAEYLVRRFRLYRFGVEEALAVCAVLYSPSPQLRKRTSLPRELRLNE